MVYLHCATGGVGVGHPEGGVDLQNGEAHPLVEKGIVARAPDVIAAGLEIDGTDPAPNPQVITVVTDTGATQSLLKDLRKATRRAGEGMSNGFNLVLVQMASSVYEGICLRGRIKTCSPRQL